MATEELVKTTGIAQHGAGRLPSVDVDSFNIEIKDEDGFLGDRASKGAFREILERWRKPLRATRQASRAGQGGTRSVSPALGRKLT